MSFKLGTVDGKAVLIKGDFYYDKEDYIYTVNPQNGAYPLTLTFNSFDIELFSLGDVIVPNGDSSW